MKKSNIGGSCCCCGLELNDNPGNSYKIRRGIWITEGKRNSARIKSVKPQAIVNHVKTKNGYLTVAISPKWSNDV